MIMGDQGPGPMPPNSMTFKPFRGPLMLSNSLFSVLSPTSVCAAGNA
jgi:hypothetical protein